MAKDTAQELNQRLNDTTITPVSPVAAYIGGKRLLSKKLVQRINAIPHTCYAEPFVGMGGVFFRRDHVAKTEVINDYSRDVANLFRVLQRHYVPFTEMLRFQLTGRHEFERLLESNPDTLTDLERAARFIYLQRVSFSGRVVARSFGVTRSNPARFDVSKVIPLLEDVHSRLTRVVIESLPFQDFIPRYDTPDTLFYLDPPYYGVEGYYGKNMFMRSDFAVLAELLASIKGRFLLSLNDKPEVRELFAAFKIEPVSLKYTVGAVNNKSTAGKEVIISNV